MSSSDDHPEAGAEQDRSGTSGTPDPREHLNREQIHLLVSNRLNQHRPAAWEDDFSRNALDELPFENLPPISARMDELKGLTDPCLDGRSVASFAVRDQAPIPGADDRERYSVGHDARYWFSGLCDYLKVCQAAARHGVDFRSFFDFGCASGRVLRHFAAQRDGLETIWGSDINARHVRWLCEYMPAQVRAIANHSFPQLPIADHSIDLITAFSVFTHIDTFETCWLAELARIVAPGGLVYITIHNEDTWNSLGGEIDNVSNRLVRGMRDVDPDVPSKLRYALPAGRTVYRFSQRGPYRAHVFHSECHLRKVWSRFFEIVEILPLHHVRQSAVVLKPKLT